MTLFDLFFIALFLAAVATLVVAAGNAVRGRGARALIIVRRLALSVAGYLVVVVVVSLASPQRYAAIGDDQCSDDWCIAVASAGHTPTGTGISHEVAFRVSSRARRVTQREHDVVVYLRDAQGRRYDSDPPGAAAPFDVPLEPGQAITTTRRFTVPGNAAIVGLVVAREGGLGPGCCVIGDEGSLFHKKTIVRLQ